MGTNYTKPVCRGSYALGTACGRCERCLDERVKLWPEKKIAPIAMSAPMSDAVEVTQEDREAETDYLRDYVHMPKGYLARCFARHRHAAHEAGKREGLEQAAIIVETHPLFLEQVSLPGVTKRDKAIATAIRALSQQETK